MTRSEKEGARIRHLVIMRHAKAERGTAAQADFDRALTERGRADAALMGSVLLAAGVQPDRVLVSSALRTRQTWEAVSPAFPRAQAEFTRKLYHADTQTLLQVVEESEEADTLMLVAHNPGVHALALRLLQAGSAPLSALARFDRGFPTATAAVFGIDEIGRASYEGLYLAAEHGGGGGE